LLSRRDINKKTTFRDSEKGFVEHQPPMDQRAKRVNPLIYKEK